LSDIGAADSVGTASAFARCYVCHCAADRSKHLERLFVQRTFGYRFLLMDDSKRQLRRIAFNGIQDFVE
jgi:hypothetical protein